MSRSEAMLIARDAASEALKAHSERLPDMMRPLMYEVATKVSETATKTFTETFTKVIGADVMNDEHIRDFHKDIYFLRDKRIQHERNVTLTKETIIIAIVKYSGILLILGVLAFFGLYKPTGAPHP